MFSLAFPEPEKHSGLWGYMLTSADAQLSCESLDWMSDGTVKLFLHMPLDVHIKLFAPNSQQDSSVTIKTASRDKHDPGVKMPANPSVGTPFHLRKKRDWTLLQYIFNRTDNEGNAVYDKQHLYQITSMLTEISRRVFPRQADPTPCVMEQLQRSLGPNSAGWIGKMLPTAADCEDVDVVILGRSLRLKPNLMGPPFFNFLFLLLIKQLPVKMFPML